MDGMKSRTSSLELPLPDLSVRARSQERARTDQSRKLFSRWFAVTIVCLPLSLFLLSLSAADNSAPIFVLHSAEGVAATGPLKEIAENWSVVVNGTKPVRVEGADL